MPDQDNKSKEEGKIILQTRMHCDACRFQVYKALSGYPGVEELSIDLKNNTVTLKAPKVDAKKLFETAKKKSKGKITKLVYPDPQDIKKKEEKKEDKKPVEVTVVLKVNMDCSSCTRKVAKAAGKVKDVQSVKTDGHTLTIKGWDLDPKKLCEEIAKKTGKHVEIVPPKKDQKQEIATKTVTECYYVYAPQYFSDENPNACAVM